MRTTNDSSSVAVSTRIVEAVAEETATPVHELDPLYYSIDPDSLESLFASTDDDRNRATTRVSFRYEGHRIAVSHDEGVDVSPVEADSPQNVSAQSSNTASKGTE